MHGRDVMVALHGVLVVKVLRGSRERDANELLGVSRWRVGTEGVVTGSSSSSRVEKDKITGGGVRQWLLRRRVV